MGALQTAFENAFRDYNTAGDPGSGAYEPDKAVLRALGGVLETYAGDFAGGAITVAEQVVANWTTAGLSIGPQSTIASRLMVLSEADEQIRGLDIYWSADQAAVSNQYPPFVIHNYTDGPSAIIDTVGNQTGLILRQARNPSSRPDKAASYVGDGPFLDFQTSRVSGAGNTGTGNDRRFWVNTLGQIESYGFNGTDWDGTSGAAPVKHGSYSGFMSKYFYEGFHLAGDKAIIGSVESGVAAKPLEYACSVLQPASDNGIDVGTASRRVREIFAGTGTINTSDQRLKKWRGEMSEAEYRAGRRVLDELGFFQWRDSMDGDPGDEEGLYARDAKGANARFHFGTRAQRVWGIFADEKLVDPIDRRGRPGKTPYAFLCFDEWEAQREPILVERETPGHIDVEAPVAGLVDTKGKRLMATKRVKAVQVDMVESGKFKVTQKAGYRYGLRVDQLALFLLAVQSRRQSEIEARLNALEK